MIFDRDGTGRFEGSVEAGDPFISVRDLKKHFDDDTLFGDPVRAVDGVSFEIRKGETLGLVGESGCGKTTLGRTLIGLESATGGAIECRGTDVTTLSGRSLREWQRNAQLVFQDPEGALNDRMTVGEIVREPLDAHEWGTSADRRERVFDFLERVGLGEEHFYRYPHQFSGGQRQRIGVARALVLEPDFLVLDEPVSALDVSVQARLINLLEDLQEELDLTYLFIAHDISVVRHIADRVAVMYLGNIVETGPTEQVFASPTHPYTASLLSAIPGSIARGSVGADRERITLQGTPPNPRDPPPGCPFATRCPAKIRPDGIEAPEAVWVALDEFRALLRERARSDTPLTGVLARYLDRGEDAVATARAELFGDLQMPERIANELDVAVDLADRGKDRQAATHLRREFGSPCDRTRPEEREAAPGQWSRCLRNDEAHEDAGTVLDRRFGAGDAVEGDETGEYQEIERRSNRP